MTDIKYRYIADFYTETSNMKLQKIIYEKMINYFIQEYKICDLMYKISITSNKKRDKIKEISPEKLDNNIIKKIKDCIKANKIILIKLSLKTLEGKSDGSNSKHSNMLFIRSNKISIIEPSNSKIDNSLLKETIKKIFNFDNFEIEYSCDYIEHGPQKIGHIKDYHGFCFVYTLYITEEWLKNPNKTLEQIYKQICDDEKCLNRNINIFNTMIKYLKRLYEKIDYYCYSSEKYSIKDNYPKDKEIILYGFYPSFPSDPVKNEYNIEIKLEDNIFREKDLFLFSINDYKFIIEYKSKNYYFIIYNKNEEYKIKYKDKYIYLIDKNNIEYRSADKIKLDFDTFHSIKVNTKYINYIKKIKKE